MSDGERQGTASTRSTREAMSRVEGRLRRAGLSPSEARRQSREAALRADGDRNAIGRSKRATLEQHQRSLDERGRR